MTFARLWAVLAILLPVLGTLIANLSSVDLAYHLRAGDQILGGGGIPRTDTWTYTAAGAPWLDQQWGAQAILASVYRVAGWTGLVILRAALVGLLFGLLFLACRLRGADIRRAAWITLAAFLISAVALALRPQLFGMVMLAATLVLVAGRHRWPRLLWLAPIIVVAWANLHGSFFLGPVVVGLAWLEDLHDRTLCSRPGEQFGCVGKVVRTEHDGDVRRPFAHALAVRWREAAAARDLELGPPLLELLVSSEMPGELVVELDSGPQQMALSESRARMASLHAQVAALSRELASERAGLQAHERLRGAERDEADAKIGEAQARARFAKSQSESRRALRSRNFISDEAVSQAQSEPSFARVFRLLAVSD